MKTINLIRIGTIGMLIILIFTLILAFTWSIAFIALSILSLIFFYIGLDMIKETERYED